MEFGEVCLYVVWSFLARARKVWESSILLGELTFEKILWIFFFCLGNYFILFFENCII